VYDRWRADLDGSAAEKDFGEDWSW